jgi:hypothetical protein
MSAFGGKADMENLSLIQCICIERTMQKHFAWGLDCIAHRPDIRFRFNIRRTMRCARSSRNCLAKSLFALPCGHISLASIDFPQRSLLSAMITTYDQKPSTYPPLKSKIFRPIPCFGSVTVARLPTIRQKCKLRGVMSRPKTGSQFACLQCGHNETVRVLVTIRLRPIA